MPTMVDRIQAIHSLYRILCELPIMVDAGYITQEEADNIRPVILAALRTALGL